MGAPASKTSTKQHIQMKDLRSYFNSNTKQQQESAATRMGGLSKINNVINDQSKSGDLNCSIGSGDKLDKERLYKGAKTHHRLY